MYTPPLEKKQITIIDIPRALIEFIYILPLVLLKLFYLIAYKIFRLDKLNANVALGFFIYKKRDKQINFHDNPLVIADHLSPADPPIMSQILRQNGPSTFKIIARFPDFHINYLKMSEKEILPLSHKKGIKKQHILSIINSIILKEYPIALFPEGVCKTIDKRKYLYQFHDLFIKESFLSGRPVVCLALDRFRLAPTLSKLLYIN